MLVFDNRLYTASTSLVHETTLDNFLTLNHSFMSYLSIYEVNEEDWLTHFFNEISINAFTITISLVDCLTNIGLNIFYGHLFIYFSIHNTRFPPKNM